MKYHFCITICGEVDTDVTPIPPPDGGSPPYIDNRPPQQPIIDAGFPTTPPGGRPQWPVDPNYGIEVPPGQEGGPPHPDIRPPEGPIIDAGFPTTPPGGWPDRPVPPEEGGPPQIDNTLPGNLPGSPPHIDADFPIHQPKPPTECDPGPQAIRRLLDRVVAIKRPKGVTIDNFDTKINAMNGRRKD